MPITRRATAPGVARRALACIGLLALAFPLGGSAQPASRARAWEGTLTLPTYDEGPPDVNAPFDLLQPAGRPNYPYTIRDGKATVTEAPGWGFEPSPEWLARSTYQVSEVRA